MPKRKAERTEPVDKWSKGVRYTDTFAQDQVQREWALARANVLKLEEEDEDDRSDG
jgi:hypothetical protein